MTNTNHESRINQKLTELNKEIGEMEQEGADAEDYFKDLLSDNLVFRRASGKVASKNDFLETLKEGSPFSSRQTEDIVVNPMVGDRILVTLIVTTTRKDNEFKQRFCNVRLFSHSGESFILEFWYNYEATDL
jgi:Domain of unknown function (DUF4440)